MLGKPAFNDMKEGIITVPLIYALLELRERGNTKEFTELNGIIHNLTGGNESSNTPEILKRGSSLLFDTCGIEVADQLSIDHINLALESLKGMRYTHNGVVD